MKPHKTTTIQDIAQLAEVSPATVARVVHGNGYVSEEKRRMIQRAIDELGYVPNKVAQGLRNRKTGLIGHVLPLPDDNPFFSRIGAALTEEAHLRGYHVLTVVSGNAAKERALVEDLCGLMVEAIVFTAQTYCESALVEWVLSRGIPVVMIERPRGIAGVDAVLLDSLEGARLAAEHFVAMGHRDVGYIGAHPSRDQVETNRLNGFVQTLCAHQLSIPPRWLQFTADYTAEWGYRATERILSKGAPPSAVFVTSDLLALGALQCLHDHGLHVPEDVSLIGYDNTLSALSTPPLTTVELHPALVARTAIDMVLERTKDQRQGAKTVALSPVLIERRSVRNLHGFPCDHTSGL